MKQLEKQNVENIDLFQKMASHEQVVFCNDPASGLQAIIAIHDTTLGPAMGGTRMHPYKSVEEALDDVLRLSEGMTYKCAAAAIDFGGAKGVIIGDPKTDKSPAMFRAYGQFVESLNGRFYTGTDMGTTMDDFVHATKETNFINGIPEAYGGGGDSSIPTSKGVIYSLEATNEFLSGDADLGARSYAIQGLGKVGFKVAAHLLETGAKLYAADINEEALKQLQAVGREYENEVEIVSNQAIYQTPADIFIPCAMGGVLNEATIPELQVKAVVGSANNQLQESGHGKMLHDRGILYAPDYIVNAGGLMQVADELYGPNKERVLMQTKTIAQKLTAIYKEASMDGITTTEAADRICKQRLEEQRRRNSFYNRARSPKWTVKE